MTDHPSLHKECQSCLGVNRQKNLMSTQRIAVNTAVTYIRFVFAAGLALFSSRWVLNALGQTDYGLFSVVGTLIVFITFLNSLMAGSAARNFAYSIGQGDRSEVKSWFNAALGIHICLAFLLILIGWPFGEYVVAHVLTIPADRLTVCIWVFHISLISAFVSMLSVPFVAMFTAKQHLTELAAWGILQSFLGFILAWFVLSATGDRLLFYAVGMVSIVIFVQAAQIFRAMIVFDECNISCKQLFDRNKCKELFSFAMWNLFGWSGALFRDQGSAILLNLFFGPSANAAFAIATQVSNQTNQFSSAMVGAFSPVITASEGSGDRARMLSLSQSASKFGTILATLLAIPLIVEMDAVLNLWLGVPPPHTVLFCQLILGTFIIDRLSTGYMLAVNAHGKIAAYQATLGTILLLTLPLGWMLLKLGHPPTSIGIAFIVTMSITSLGRVLWGRHLFGIAFHSWLTAVVWPCGIIALVGTVAAMAPQWLLQPSFLRIVLSTIASITSSLLSVWIFALDRKERGFIHDAVRRFFDRPVITRIFKKKSYDNNFSGKKY